MKTNDYQFRKAIPVWECGTQKTMNRSLVLVAETDKADYTLALAASCAYIVIVNDTLVAHGPARAAHGFYRVDELEIGQYLTEEKNKIEVRVFGYNINTFEYLDQPSFIAAELILDGCVKAYTAAPASVGFSIYGFDERIMKVQRYSYQRAFVENYRLGENTFKYDSREPLALEATDEKHFICRDICYGDYARIYPKCVIGRGTVSYSDKDRYHSNIAITDICDTYRGYREDELEYASHVEIGKMDYSDRVEADIPFDVIDLEPDTYVDLDMDKNYTGLFELELEAHGDGEFFITFDEILTNGKLNCFRIEPCSILSFVCKKGTYKIVSAEPYVMKYARVIAKGASFTVKNFKLIEIAFPESKITATFHSDDKVMEKIYDAAKLTFRANTVDIYFDCPSRERAGWLCDSFFTSRVEYALTGKCEVEKQFLANFLMPEKLPHVPEGMLPMCYPSDHDQTHSSFIPSWAMFYGIELREYLDRSGDRELIDGAKDRMYSLCKYFEKFENEFGLLERLESWVFVEWSYANKLVQDVSFANNMLYSLFLRGIGELYNDSALIAKSEKLKVTINEMAMTESGFYCDNAVRRDGKLVLSGERTEACQYYAFFCSVATPETHEWLWNTLVNDFGYNRGKSPASQEDKFFFNSSASADSAQKENKYPEIHPANAFIGNYLRLDLLDRYDYRDELYDNIKGYFEYMADRTGTLWELVSDNASCNHGFASHVIHWMKSLGMVE